MISLFSLTSKQFLNLNLDLLSDLVKMSTTHSLAEQYQSSTSLDNTLSHTKW
eukprot:c32309_g1_i1 orf=20-175(-)